MIVEIGEETVFYASFVNPEGKRAVLVSRPVIELFLESESVFKARMQKEKNYFFLKKKIELKPGNYMVAYSAVDTDGVKLLGEENLTVVEKNIEIQKMNEELQKFGKIYKGECKSIIERLKKQAENVTAIKSMLKKLLPSKKIEELVMNEK